MAGKHGGTLRFCLASVFSWAFVFCGKLEELRDMRDRVQRFQEGRLVTLDTAERLRPVRANDGHWVWPEGGRGVREAAARGREQRPREVGKRVQGREAP